MKKVTYIFTILNLITFYSFAEQKKIEGVDGKTGFYDASTKTAFLGEGDDKAFYEDVVEYSQSVTPPNIMYKNPDLKQFATMPNPKYTFSEKILMGGQFERTQLFGVKQASKKLKKGRKKETYVIFGSKGVYDPKTKTAYLVDSSYNSTTKYTDVVEYSQSVTPPNIMYKNPDLKPFATMPNPRYKKSKKILKGGQTPNITLYGIKQD